MHVSPRVRKLSFHDLRRSHGSLLAAAGVTLTHAQRLMRHSDPRLTQDVYTVADVETLRVEVERMSFLGHVPTVSRNRGHGAPQAPGSHPKAGERPSETAGVGMWLGPESNREPTDYETVALTS